MRTNITLKVSITGTLINEIDITGIFSSLTLNIWTAYASGAEVIYVIRNVAIQKPIKRDPASPSGLYEIMTWRNRLKKLLSIHQFHRSS